MLKKYLRIGAVALSMGFVGAMPMIVNADNYPNRTITHYFPWPAESKTYAIAQYIANGMAEELGEKMTVVSKPGAGGVKAAKQAMGKPADGYTTFDGYIAPLIIAQLFGNADYTHNDFIPLQSGVYNAFAIAIRQDETRFTNINELLEYVKANPKKVRYTAGPQIALPHMVGAKLLQTSNAIARHIPADSMNAGLTMLRQGVVDFSLVNPGVYNANKSKMRVISVLTDLKKAKQVYDGAPLIGEQGIDLGLSGLGSVGWDWWVVPKGTPAHIVKTLRQAMSKSKAKPDVQNKIAATGFVILPYEYDQYDAIMSSAQKQIKSAVAAIEWENAHFK